jgi:hypothetical protein
MTPYLHRAWALRDIDNAAGEAHMRYMTQDSQLAIWVTTKSAAIDLARQAGRSAIQLSSGADAEATLAAVEAARLSARAVLAGL